MAVADGSVLLIPGLVFGRVGVEVLRFRWRLFGVFFVREKHVAEVDGRFDFLIVLPAAGNDEVEFLGGGGADDFHHPADELRVGRIAEEEIDRFGVEGLLRELGADDEDAGGQLALQDGALFDGVECVRTAFGEGVEHFAISGADVEHAAVEAGFAGLVLLAEVMEEKGVEDFIRGRVEFVVLTGGMELGDELHGHEKARARRAG